MESTVIFNDQCIAHLLMLSMPVKISKLLVKSACGNDQNIITYCFRPLRIHQNNASTSFDYIHCALINPILYEEWVSLQTFDRHVQITDSTNECAQKVAVASQF